MTDIRSVPSDLSQAARDVLAERARQIHGEGWSEEHDDAHGDRELAAASAAYAYVASLPDSHRPGLTLYPIPVGCISILERIWPASWATWWFKPKTAREDLVRACALGIAEIERLDRAAARAAIEAGQVGKAKQ